MNVARAVMAKSVKPQCLDLKDMLRNQAATTAKIQFQNGALTYPQYLNEIALIQLLTGPRGRMYAALSVVQAEALAMISTEEDIVRDCGKLIELLEIRKDYKPD